MGSQEEEEEEDKEGEESGRVVFWKGGRLFTGVTFSPSLCKQVAKAQFDYCFTPALWGLPNIYPPSANLTTVCVCEVQGQSAGGTLAANRTPACGSPAGLLCTQTRK